MTMRSKWFRRASSTMAVPTADEARHTVFASGMPARDLVDVDDRDRCA
jgi:hypothetical protein